MSEVMSVCAKHHGREIPSIYTVEPLFVQLSLALRPHTAFEEEFRDEAGLQEHEQLVIAEYGTEPQRFFAFPKALDKYSFMPALRLALLHDTGMIWQTRPDV